MERNHENENWKMSIVVEKYAASVEKLTGN